MREDGGSEWPERQGRIAVNAKSGEIGWKNPGNQQIQKKFPKHQVHCNGNGSIMNNDNNCLARFQGAKKISNLNYGPEKDELNGLQLIERKRMRGGPNSYEVMDVEGGLKAITGEEQTSRKTEVDLSAIDCSTSSNNELAKLAQQASQHP